MTPAFIQTGNEISYGMLWGPLGTASPKKAFMGSDANWQRFGNLLSRAIEACREVCPQAKIIIHTERVGQIDVLTNFYEKISELDVDYDIIGLSYYPFWHGGMKQLSDALSVLEKEFSSKNIMIVETGYALKWQVPYQGIIDHTHVWPISDEAKPSLPVTLWPPLKSILWSTDFSGGGWSTTHMALIYPDGIMHRCLTPPQVGHPPHSR